MIEPVERRILLAAHVTQVFAGGPGLNGGSPTPGQQAFRAAAGVNPFQGYPVPSGAGQLRTLPWVGGVSTISLGFDEDVVGRVGLLDYTLRNTTTDYFILATYYDPAGHISRVEIPDAAVTADKLRLILGADGVPGLDGEWLNGVSAYPSGDGAAGGDFNFRVNVLEGDATGDGRVNALDVAFIKQRLGLTPNSAPVGAATYSIFADLTADGRIDALDMAAAKRRLNRSLPTVEPAGQASASAPGDLPLAQGFFNESSPTGPLGF